MHTDAHTFVFRGKMFVKFSSRGLKLKLVAHRWQEGV